MPRLPVPENDADQWGTLLNEFLRVAHRDDGTLRGAPDVANVRDFGAVGDGTTDDSQAFQSALNTRKRVYIPNGTYAVKDLDPPSNSIITCESLSSVIRGVKPQEPTSNTKISSIFHTHQLRSLISINGGTWGECKYVWHHTGDRSLNSSTFESMSIDQCEDGFRISASVGNVWRNIRIDNVAYGWYLGEGKENVINMNRFLECKVFRYSLGGIYFVSDENKPKRGNTVWSCWFEDADSPAISAGGGSSHLVITNCYFESTGNAEYADIILKDLGSIDISPTVIIDVCHFAAPKPSQEHRLMVQGNVALLAKDNTVILRSRDVFVRVEGLNDHVIQLINNSINNTGDRTYKSRLYSSDDCQDVRWSKYWLTME